MFIYFTWMNAPAAPDELEKRRRRCQPPTRPPRSDPARMHGRPHVSRQESIVDEEILFDVERWIAALEVAHAIVLHSMAQDQILRARGRANRVCLDEADAADRSIERGGWEEAPGHGERPEVVKRERHRRER